MKIAHTFEGISRSVRFRALMAISGIFLTIAVLLAGIWKENFHVIFQDYAQRWASHHLSTLGSALVPFLIQNQLSAVHASLDEALVRADTWKTLQLLDNDGIQLYPIDPVQPVTSPHLVTMVHNINFRNTDLGTLVLTADYSAIQASVLEMSYLLAGGALLGMLLITFGAAAVFETVLLRPLSGLGRAAEAVANGDYGHELPEARDGAIRQLVSNFSAMRSAIEQHAKNLYQAKEAAEKANEAKNAFLAKMSHELRTPLNGMLGMAHLLENSSLSAAQRQQVAVLGHSGTMLLGLLDQLIELTRLEENKLTLKVSDFDLGALMHQVFESWAPEAAAKKLSFVIDGTAITHQMLSGDHARLSRIIGILIGNALKFTPSGEIRVRITQTEEEGPDITTRFEVSDTGIGIASEKISSLFEKFVQADDGMAREYDGAGLGLAVAKGLAERMGGEIGVDSAESEGSIFWFTVRFARAEGDAAPIGLLEQRSASLSPLPGKRPLRILIAEDNLINQQVICGMLARGGYDIATVENGAQAVAAVSRGDFDLVLMDINMPVMTGLEATQRIRALSDERSEIPIIAVTANTGDSDRDKYLEEGMTGYVPKPILPKTLAEAIENAVGQPVTVVPVAEPEITPAGEPTEAFENDLDAFLSSLDCTIPEPANAGPPAGAEARKAGANR